MAEGGVGTCPQVFVVDSEASYISQPSRKSWRWARVSQKFLLLLVGLSLLGLVVEGCFIYRLYKTTENLSHPQTSGQQGDAIMRQEGPKESNEIPIVPPRLDQDQQRPFAHLIGTSHQIGEDKVVLWGYDVTHNMAYDNRGRLSVEKEGYYYIYSKVTLNAAEECSVILHKVMKDTDAYGEPMVLMRSKSNRCRPTPSTKASGGEDLWNSFLGGIFYLRSTDKIYVTLENITRIQPEPGDNFMGAFMIFPGNIPQ
ncbi:hypothetical protein VZT92_002350 [Zoarces viviparus]|uniref:THD domain-containing protein n=1 Tax=Zoarces viviparus TaxID=48416 RepID=A0AAW1FZC3_ZOAVI